MADASNNEVQTTNHRRSENYIDEYVTKFSMSGLETDGERYVHLRLGRTSMDVGGEKHTFDDNGNLTSIAPKDLEVYRLNVAGLTLPLSLVQELRDAFTEALEEPHDGSED
ncbi:hypothetical protein [Vreelandella jeotgali]|uniref:hypothetical protein n=1 Tax=Vreelandella jeotgali TaxID=553386 RepID=UPI00037D3575|nr:hypothetical protein [Halomonas jeotgali]